MEEPVNETRTKDVELTYIPWLAKVNERVRMVLECIKDKRDNILESDYEILRALHGLWFHGEIPLFQTIQIPTTTKVVEQTLFNDKTEEMAETTVTNPDNFDDARDKILDGTNVDSVPVKSKRTKK